MKTTTLLDRTRGLVGAKVEGFTYLHHRTTGKIMVAVKPPAGPIYRCYHSIDGNTWVAVEKELSADAAAKLLGLTSVRTHRKRKPL